MTFRPTISLASETHTEQKRQEVTQQADTALAGSARTAAAGRLWSALGQGLCPVSSGRALGSSSLFEVVGQRAPV